MLNLHLSKISVCNIMIPSFNQIWSRRKFLISVPRTDLYLSVMYYNYTRVEILMCNIMVPSFNQIWSRRKFLTSANCTKTYPSQTYQYIRLYYNIAEPFSHLRQTWHSDCIRGSGGGRYGLIIRSNFFHFVSQK